MCRHHHDWSHSANQDGLESLPIDSPKVVRVYLCNILGRDKLMAPTSSERTWRKPRSWNYLYASTSWSLLSPSASSRPVLPTMDSLVPISAGTLIQNPSLPRTMSSLTLFTRSLRATCILISRISKLAHAWRISLPPTSRFSINKACTRSQKTTKSLPYSTSSRQSILSLFVFDLNPIWRSITQKCARTSKISWSMQFVCLDYFSSLTTIRYFDISYTAEVRFKQTGSSKLHWQSRQFQKTRQERRQR